MKKLTVVSAIMVLGLVRPSFADQSLEKPDEKAAQVEQIFDGKEGSLPVTAGNGEVAHVPNKRLVNMIQRKIQDQEKLAARISKASNNWAKASNRKTIYDVSSKALAIGGAASGAVGLSLLMLGVLAQTAIFVMGTVIFIHGVAAIFTGVALRNGVRKAQEDGDAAAAERRQLGLEQDRSRRETSNLIDLLNKEVS